MTLMLAIQYLQPEPGIEERSIEAIRNKLKTVAGILPITHLLLGWNIPQQFVDACRQEAQRLNFKIYRWQPLLSGDGMIRLQPEWRARNMVGTPIPSPDGSEEFTFVCPNHPSVLNAVQEHIQSIISLHQYDGLFLDRIRFPGLGYDPLANLGCFCEHCQRRADESGINLGEVKEHLNQLVQTSEGRIGIMQSLLGVHPLQPGSGVDDPISRFMQFRLASITRFVQIIAEQIQQAGLQVGLDCFAPSLSRLVGQDLRALGLNAGWIKVMTYAHVNAPAGMPYELTGFLDWLVQGGIPESEALAALGRASHLQLPESRQQLIRNGLNSTTLRSEISRGVLESSAPLLAGIELVEFPGVSELNARQIRSDLQAVLAVNPAGLALSWDLWHIPDERLRIVAEELKKNGGL